MENKEGGRKRGKERCPQELTESLGVLKRRGSQGLKCQLGWRWVVSGYWKERLCPRDTSDEEGVQAENMYTKAGKKLPPAPVCRSLNIIEWLGSLVA